MFLNEPLTILLSDRNLTHPLDPQRHNDPQSLSWPCRRPPETQRGHRPRQCLAQGNYWVETEEPPPDSELYSTATTRVDLCRTHRLVPGNFLKDNMFRTHGNDWCDALQHREENLKL